MLKAIFNFFLNLDRAFASLFGARSPEETISSEIGRHESQPEVKIVADVLDAAQPQHVEKAVAEADKLEAAK